MGERHLSFGYRDGRCVPISAEAPDSRRAADSRSDPGLSTLSTVDEADRLNLENPPDRTSELFENFLPYALALDVEQSWAKQFSGILEGAGTSPD